MGPIKEGSFLFKVAYGATSKNNIPNQVNLCRFFWRCVLMFFIVWPICWTFVGFAILIGSVIGILFGYRIDLRNHRATELFVPIKRWPTIMGKRWWPVAILEILLGIYFFYWFLSSVSNPVFMSALCQTVPFVTFAGVILAIILITVSVAWFGQSSVGKMIRAYIKAKKQKICPMIPIIKKAKEEREAEPSSL